MGMGIGGIMKMVAFILIAVAFALSFFMFRKRGGIPISSFLVAAVFGGFFAVYLAGFIASLGSGGIDSDHSRTWAIYACCAMFGAGFRMMYIPILNGCGDDMNCFMTMLSGFCAVAASVFCFLDALFGK